MKPILLMSMLLVATPASTPPKSPAPARDWSVTLKDAYAEGSESLVCSRQGPHELHCGDLTQFMEMVEQLRQEREEIEARKEALRQRHLLNSRPAPIEM